MAGNPHYNRGSREYTTFREAQAGGTILGTFTVGDPVEDQEPQHFVITTHRLPWSGINRQHYRLYVVHSQEDGLLRPSDHMEWIGVIVWNLYGGSGGPSRTAAIANAEIFDEDYRGRGLGRRLYVASINDLIDRQRVPISDVYRSEYAEHVWSSLMEANPGTIEAHQRVVQSPPGEDIIGRTEADFGSEEAYSGMIRERPQYYEVQGYVQRHPDVRVKSHRRRSPR